METATPLRLINNGEQTSTSALALGYPLFSPSRHVRTCYCMPHCSLGSLCRDPFRHEEFRPLYLSPLCLLWVFRSTHSSSLCDYMPLFFRYVTFCAVSIQRLIRQPTTCILHAINTPHLNCLISSCFPPRPPPYRHAPQILKMGHFQVSGDSRHLLKILSYGTLEIENGFTQLYGGGRCLELQAQGTMSVPMLFR